MLQCELGAEGGVRTLVSSVPVMPRRHCCLVNVLLQLLPSDALWNIAEPHLESIGARHIDEVKPPQIDTPQEAATQTCWNSAQTEIQEWDARGTFSESSTFRALPLPLPLPCHSQMQSLEGSTEMRRLWGDLGYIGFMAFL